MTSRELVKSCLHFQGVDRLPYDFEPKRGSDFVWANADPHPDPLGNPDLAIKEWIDEWGCHWKRLGNTLLGEVQNAALSSYQDLNGFKFPNLTLPSRWKKIRNLAIDKEDRYALAGGGSLYFRPTFLRGMENIWTDIYDDPDGLSALIDRLADYNIEMMKIYRGLGADGFIMGDDWGLQNTLQISPVKWREIWKPKYERVFKAAHGLAMEVFLHSCGYIVDILDDLIEIGLHAIHMDQQENMGLENLGRRFGGRINFFAPVDIQKTMCLGSLDEIRSYCREMVKWFHTPQGGFIPRWYTDPVGVGHRRDALDAMYDEFFSISREMYNQ